LQAATSLEWRSGNNMHDRFHLESAAAAQQDDACLLIV
jgi:hypothetical protein